MLSLYKYGANNTLKLLYQKVIN